MFPEVKILPAVIPQSLQDLLASEGQLVVLECRVKGVPSPRVDWYRDKKIIEDSPDFRILQKSRLGCYITSAYEFDVFFCSYSAATLELH